jgi:hypothetical protein
MGQDREDRQSDDAGLTGSPGQQQPLPDFQREIAAAARYERGLLPKAVTVLALVVAVAVLRTLHLL